MPEFVKLLTDDQNTITHMLTLEEEFVSVEDLAAMLDRGEECFVTFGEEKRFPITLVAEDGHLEPTIDDASGEYTIWDLPREDDPAEEEIETMYGEMERFGEFDVDEGQGEEDTDGDNLRTFR